MKNLMTVLLLSLFTVQSVMAQKKDTILVTPKNINTSVLKEGTHRYLVYFKMSKDASRTHTQFWTRSIKRSTQNGTPVITVMQEWEDKDSVMHTVTSVCNGLTMQPLTHKFWWKKRGTVSVDFENGGSISVNDVLLSDADTAKQMKAIWSAFKTAGNKYFLNWHLDMEVFPMLPYRNGITFLIPFYDPGTGAALETVAYSVTGTAQLAGYDNQKIDCWLLEHISDGNREVFWISKKTKEVLKLEQEINGTWYRYKIKLGFSI